MSRVVVRAGIFVVIALLSACAKQVPQRVYPNVATCADSSLRGGIQGTTTDAVTGQRISTQIVLQGDQLIWSDTDGEFAFPCLKTGEYKLQARLIGYTPISVTVQVRSDSLTHVDLRPRIPDSGPAADSSLWQPLWEAALALYRRPAPPSDVRHLSGVADATGTPAPVIPEKPPVVLLTRDAYWTTPGARAWVSGLLSLKKIDLVCDANDLSKCPNVGFGSFVELKVPVQATPDTVAIRIDETLLDPVACQRGQGMGDHHSFGVALVKSDIGWQVVGRIGLDLIGGIYCGR